MMMNLFSMFDPCTLLFNELNWIIIIMSLTVLPVNLYLINSYYNTTMNLLFSYLFKEFLILLNSCPMILMVMINSFILVLLSNLFGLMPYVMNGTSSLAFTLTISLFFFLSGFLLSLVYNLESVLAHFTPQGSLPVLIPFMVIIELISLMIRPVTLAVRLSANMVAGHLLMSLVSGSMETSEFFFVGSLGQIFFTLMETAVALIQGYVFLVLIVLYSNDSLA